MSDVVTQQPGSQAPALEARGIVKTFHQGDNTIDVLRNVNLQLAEAERVAVVGRSGSGKSTLLHILAGLDSADGGTVRIAGVDMSGADVNERARIRGRYMGFVYQNHHLLPEFTALENVAMPLRILGTAQRAARDQAAELLADVGLAERLQHLPSALSGGERQRVAVARALAGNPRVVLADEPTGNLDQDNAHAVMELIAELSKQHQTAFLIVTHDVGMLGAFDRVLTLENGTLVAPADVSQAT